MTVSACGTTGRDLQLDCQPTWTVPAGLTAGRAVVSLVDLDDLFSKTWEETMAALRIPTTAFDTACDGASLYGLSEKELVDDVDTMLYGIDTVVNIPLPDSDDVEEDNKNANEDKPTSSGPASYPVFVAVSVSAASAIVAFEEVRRARLYQG